jgi:subtilisin family serine protease
MSISVIGVSGVCAEPTARRNVKIWVVQIDSGIDYRHNCIAGTVGAIANTSGVRGVAPGVTLCPIRVLDSSGSGAWSDIIAGIDYVTKLLLTADAGVRNALSGRERACAK